MLAANPVLAQHDMRHMTSGTDSLLPLGIPLSRLGSGTSWLPDSSPMHAHHISVGDWVLMLHGVAYGQYDHQDGFRGATQTGLLDWEMLEAVHQFAGGAIRFAGMML